MAKIKKEKIVSENLFDKLTSIRFFAGGKQFEVNIGSELLFETDLHSQVERLPAVMGYFSSVVAQLEKEYEDKKVQVKVIEAKIDKKVRETGVIGEERIAKAIRRHSKWYEVSIEANEAKRNWVRGKGLFASLKEKAMAMNIRSSDLRSVPSDSIMGCTREDIVGNIGED